MITSSRARLSALTASGLLSLALVTGCSGGSDAKPDAAKSSGASSAAGDGTSGRARSADELAGLVVTSGDVEGFEVTEPGQDDLFGGSWKDLKVEGGDGCDPLVRALSGSPVGEAAAHLSRQATQQRPEAPGEGDSPSLADAMRLDVTTVTLATYDGDGAEQAMKSVSEAVKSCSDGFTVTLPGEEPSSYDEITSEKGVPAEGAEETVAFGLTGEPFEKGGSATSVHGQVVRHGNEVVTYLTVNLGDMADGERYEVSAPVVAAQAKKLS
jgi:hypothetical protein